jgi:hypothetical protein
MKDKIIQIFKVTPPFVILLTAFMQWAGIAERTYHAWWMWNKLKDYGGDGHTDMSFEMITFTYVVSIVLASFGFYFGRHSRQGVWLRCLNNIGIIMLLLGVLWLSMLLLSPFAVAVKR